MYRNDYLFAHRFGRLPCSERNTVVSFAPNLELLFTQHESFVDRLNAAADAGFTNVELWFTSTLDVEALAAAAKSRGVKITSILAEPRFNFTLPGQDLNIFFDGLRAAIANAKILGAQNVVLGSGVGFPGKKRQPQLDQLVEVFKDAAKIAEAEGVTLILEPVNTRVDHPGALLDRTEEGIYIAKGVGSPNFKILYDVYHSTVEQENPIELVAKHSNLIGYIQIADAPGRGEPGSGKIDWPATIAAIEASGYAAPIGLEFYPTKDSVEAVEYIQGFAK